MSFQRVFRPMLMGVIALLMAATLSPFGGVVAAKSNATVHYIYADDGLCPDSIDGYQITGSKLVPTPGTSLLPVKRAVRNSWSLGITRWQ